MPTIMVVMGGCRAEGGVERKSGAAPQERANNPVPAPRTVERDDPLGAAKHPSPGRESYLYRGG